MKQYRVVKEIKRKDKIIALAGDILTIIEQPNRLGGIKALYNGDVFICEIGSNIETEYCKLVKYR